MKQHFRTYKAWCVLLLWLMMQGGAHLALFSFSLNRSYIISEKCINRFNPELNCEGNCQLMQAMQREFSGSIDNSQAVRVHDNLVLFIEPVIDISIPVFMLHTGFNHTFLPQPDGVQSVISPPPQQV